MRELSSNIKGDPDRVLKHSRIFILRCLVTMISGHQIRSQRPDTPQYVAMGHQRRRKKQSEGCRMARVTCDPPAKADRTNKVGMASDRRLRRIAPIRINACKKSSGSVNRYATTVSSSPNGMAHQRQQKKGHQDPDSRQDGAPHCSRKKARERAAPRRAAHCECVRVRASNRRTVPSWAIQRKRRLSNA